MKAAKSLLALILITMQAACMRVPLENPLEAMRPVEAQLINDDLSLNSLDTALESQIHFLEKEKSQNPISFGPRQVEKKKYISALKALLEKVKSNPSQTELNNYISTNFEFYEVYGQKEWGDVHITSYFEPVMPGSKVRTEKYSQPLYRKPEDILVLDLSKWSEKYAGDRNMRARAVGSVLHPYYSREEIDSKNVLAGRNLELCWADPIDAFFLQIQGSGTVVFEDGTQIKLNYADKNGQPYKALGNFLLDQIPLAEMNMSNIEKYLRSLSPQELQKLLNNNPSYVFFTIGEKSAVTASGIPASAGRTIATDRRFFPKKTLALLQFEKPTIVEKDGKTDFGKQEVSRLVFDQDVGGAILGGGRVDLFWGKGEEAKQLAGRVNTRGKLFYLVPR